MSSAFPVDSTQRKQAIDPHQSFIIQAPAGSGKTELLTQRYLRLLSCVTAPEQIIALTFTRKAASEMRERIMLALEQAAKGVTPQSPHQKETYQYAEAVLARSHALAWSLLKQPTRLKILTIDSLCQMLTQAMPLQEKHVPFAKVTEIPQIHYQNAARNCLLYAIGTLETQAHVKCLLKHLDNNQDKLITLFCDLLSSREQWLPSLYLAREQTKAHFEEMLAAIEETALKRLRESIPISIRQELRWLAYQAGRLETNAQSIRAHLSNWLDFDKLDRNIALSLASLCLTSTQQLRRQFDHHVGLKKGLCPDDLYYDLKNKSKTILTALAETDGFLMALAHVNELPLPTYTTSQWEVLQALLMLLPLLVGHLYVTFNEESAVDFSGLSQQASSALGSDEEPTDLALYLDNTIQHLLIDEFQDTSLQQFHLLTQLVRGWSAGDGRTLFLVGDPMQSIYRFRQAEVGLFLKAKEEGVGSLSLTFLELSCNFRATETLVNWVNDQFIKIFPRKENIEMGAIRFHSSKSIKTIEANLTHVNAFYCEDSGAEAAAIVDLVSQTLTDYPQDTIAILVRSRGQLTHLLQKLRERDIAFQGVEIESLAGLPHLRDLWSLTQLLLYPANRLAWLTVLRAPWCGLTLIDLHCLANYKPQSCLQEAFRSLDALGLSQDGYHRISWVTKIIHIALSKRHQQPLIDWIMQTFRTLKGTVFLTTEETADLDQYWLLLERFTTPNTYPNLEEFNQAFNQAYSQRSKPARLQIMTIHKSKGLEFDSVIIPHLGAAVHRQQQPLLRWLKVPSPHKKTPLLLVSPIKAASDEKCLLYQYLGKVEMEKTQFEMQRLLYVAVTRAKKRLYLFDYQEKEKAGSFRQLLARQKFDPVVSAVEPTNMPFLEQTRPVLVRLPQIHYSQEQLSYASRADFQSPAKYSHTKMQPYSIARQLGIIVHELLQWMCTYHVQTLDNIPWKLLLNRLKSAGFTFDNQQAAYTKVRKQIQDFLQDPIAQWILQSHTDQQNEYALLVQNVDNDKLLTETRIIDRTFIDKGIRWIIDFKTGKNDNEDQGLGNPQAVSSHRKQLNLYAKLFTQMPSSQLFPFNSICCGLYYLSTGQWIHWEYETETMLSVNE